MRSLLIIYMFLFISCDSSGLGVGEFDPNTFDYYDYVAYGWASLFSDNYQDAINYFNQCLEAEDVENKNSAYVGLGWATTLSANEFLETDACLDSQTNCQELVDDLRLDAEEHFDNADVDKQLALDEYNECTHQNCFEDFTEDLDLGVIYLDVLKYYLSDANALSLSTIINNIESFLFTNTDYDIMTNKPITFDSKYDFNYKNVTVLLAQLLLRDDTNDCAESAAEFYLIENEVCGNLRSDNLFNIYRTDQNSNELITTDCGTLLEFSALTTSESDIITDFTFYDVNNDEIVVYFDPDGDEISDGCSLPDFDFDNDGNMDNYIAYKNGETEDYLLYNIVDDIKNFQIKYSKEIFIVESENDVLNEHFQYLEGCYDIGTLETDSSDDECICEEIDESLIFECIQTYGFSY